MGENNTAQSSYANKDRVKGMQNYEINKYINQDMKPIHMPHMANFKRAEVDDPGQSSPRASMETTIIKNLILSYFATVRKTMNDMVPKTIMAFLVNKSKT